MIISEMFNLEELDVYTFNGDDITVVDNQLKPGDAYYYQAIDGIKYVAVTKGTIIIGSELVKIIE